MRAAQRLFGARAALAVGMTAAALACATGPGDVQYASEGPVLATFDGLRRVDNWGFGFAFVKPGVNLARYDSVFIGPVSLGYKAPPSPAQTSPDGVQSGTYLLAPHTAEAFKGYLQKILANELGESEGLVVTQRPASNAIRVTSYIVDLVVHIPPDWGVGNAVTAFVANRGEFTLVLDLRDAKSGEPLLRVGGPAVIKFDNASAYIQTDPVTNAAAVRRLFWESAVRLRRRLDELRALPEIPPAPKLARNGG